MTKDFNLSDLIKECGNDFDTLGQKSGDVEKPWVASGLTKRVSDIGHEQIKVDGKTPEEAVKGLIVELIRFKERDRVKDVILNFTKTI